MSKYQHVFSVFLGGEQGSSESIVLTDVLLIQPGHILLKHCYNSSKLTISHQWNANNISAHVVIPAALWCLINWRIIILLLSSSSSLTGLAGGSIGTLKYKWQNAIQCIKP